MPELVVAILCLSRAVQPARTHVAECVVSAPTNIANHLIWRSLVSDVLARQLPRHCIVREVGTITMRDEINIGGRLSLPQYSTCGVDIEIGSVAEPIPF